MNVVAFLQNQWFPRHEVARVRKIMYAHRNNLHVHARLSTFFLFRSCYTGKVLRQVFGRETCAKIIWENASPHIGDKPDASFPPDPEHIRKVIAHFKPRAILAFGLQAQKGLSLVQPDLPIIVGPHPAARIPARGNLLQSMAEQLQSITNWSVHGG